MNFNKINSAFFTLAMAEIDSIYDAVGLQIDGNIFCLNSNFGEFIYFKFTFSLFNSNYRGCLRSGCNVHFKNTREKYRFPCLMRVSLEGSELIWFLFL